MVTLQTYKQDNFFPPSISSNQTSKTFYFWKEPVEEERLMQNINQERQQRRGY